ncbi:MAG: type II toxin-antitoxin system PemK/MazF family toxin [Rickettsiales bacterium]|nr:type II toxin-antitoxin system PemK/MazF family toxin [Rickettsiales bacterium]
MTEYKFGDILIAKVPFTDFSHQKKRPIVIVSKNILFEEKGDLLFMPISSRIINARISLNEFFISDILSAGLPKKSFIKASIFTIQTSLIEKKLGSLSKEDEKSLITLINTII